MLTFVMKWASVAALLVALAWRASTGYELLLYFVICAGAGLATVQSYTLGQHGLSIGFLVIAVLFNPVLQVVVPRTLFLWLATISLGLFLISLRALRMPPRLSIASITDRTPGSESL